VSHALPEADGARPSRTRAPVSVAGRDARRAAHDRLPTTPAARAALALTIGSEGWRLLTAVDHADAPVLATRGARRCYAAPGLDPKLSEGRHPTALA
jgi:hypothetical protein